MPLELSAITGTRVKRGAEKGFAGLNRQEAVIKARERLGLPTQPKPGDFEAIYRHALVEWGVFKPEPVLDFFRDQRIYDAFRRAWHENDPRLLQAEAEGVVQWAEEFGTFRGLEYDPRHETAAFTAALSLIVDYTRTAAEARQDAALAELQKQMDEVLALIRNLSPSRTPHEAELADVRRQLNDILARLSGLTLAPAQGAATGDVYFSGQFQNVIINLLSHLENVGQTTTAAAGSATRLYDPPPLPPLDEHGRPPLPEARRDLPPGSRLPYEPNPLFTGREDELRALARALLYPDLSGVGRPDLPPIHLSRSRLAL